MSAKRKHRRHWYRIHTRECVLCGGGTVERERVHGRKPKDPMKRYTYEQFGHAGHFL